MLIKFLFFCFSLQICLAYAADQHPNPKDLEAILGLAGRYQLEQRFEEIEAITPGYLTRPTYTSASTELIKVIEHTPERISLQHIQIVEDVQNSERLVTKGQRQEWIFESQRMHRYEGHQLWRPHYFGASDVSEAWTLSIFEADDSPAYQAVGRWHHSPEGSSWQSTSVWLPVPARETSHRDDYDLIIGSVGYEITTTGWLRHDDNIKASLSANSATDFTALAHERGAHQYTRIAQAFDSKADDYWRQTAHFWHDVRSVWREAFNQESAFTFSPRGEYLDLYTVLDGLAACFHHDDQYDSNIASNMIRESINQHLTVTGR
jgi:hypothetical protein